MTNLDHQYKSIFDRAKASCSLLLDAQEDMKQLKADAKEELITEGMSKDDAKEIRKDLGEVFVLAMVEARGELETKKCGEKIERRQRIAHIVGVQLGLNLEPADDLDIPSQFKGAPARLAEKATA